MKVIYPSNECLPSISMCQEQLIFSQLIVKERENEPLKNTKGEVIINLLKHIKPLGQKSSKRK